MQDRFKFRYWDKQIKKMRFGDIQMGCNGKPFVITGDITEPCPLIQFIDDVIPMQCTGLKDKNGKLIYEGDIIKRTYLNPSIEYHAVYYECFYSSFKLDNGECLDKTFAEYYEVIGNIYENPELLEE